MRRRGNTFTSTHTVSILASVLALVLKKVVCVVMAWAIAEVLQAIALLVIVESQVGS